MREKYSTLAFHALVLALFLLASCSRARPENGQGKPQAGSPPLPGDSAAGQAVPMSTVQDRGSTQGGQALPPAAPGPAPQAAPQAKPQTKPMKAPPATPLAAPALPMAPEGAESREEKKAASAAPPLLPPQLASRHAFGLAAPQGPILPEDLSLGPLQDYRTGSKAEAEALAVSRLFLDGILKGEFPKAGVDPERKELIALLASELLKAPHPESYRLGSIAMPDPGAFSAAAAATATAAAGSPPRDEGEADAVARFRLDYPKTAKEGELTLRFTLGSWYVESISFETVKTPERP